MMKLFKDATFKDGWMCLQDLANGAKINLKVYYLPLKPPIIEPDKTEDQYDDWSSYRERFLDSPLDYERPI